MLRGYQLMKGHALAGEKTRTILTQGLVGLNESSIVALPTLSSVKRTIHRHKSLVEENVINHDSAIELRIPDRYRFILKEESFLIYDSGMGDYYDLINIPFNKWQPIPP
ncbi:hypothetical protein LOD99_11833 [Oopsacas minuta]|uniref:Uncharacterized protein n=1 Tax=Oopsacas minuta TaxID=111878 RepID=A0AAV7JKJ9_9METZ|nr:hypothetical protein LOD99_11833 [Oopsacas minuta]